MELYSFQQRSSRLNQTLTGSETIKCWADQWLDILSQLLRLFSDLSRHHQLLPNPLIDKRLRAAVCSRSHNSCTCVSFIQLSLCVFHFCLPLRHSPLSPLHVCRSVTFKETPSSSCMIGIHTISSSAAKLHVMSFLSCFSYPHLFLSSLLSHFPSSTFLSFHQMKL